MRILALDAIYEELCTLQNKGHPYIKALDGYDRSYTESLSVHANCYRDNTDTELQRVVNHLPSHPITYPLGRLLCFRTRY